jgi:Protein of unknown function (DUF2892)
MDSNLAPYDQLVRIIIGVTAGWEFFIMPNHWWLILFSFGFLISGLLGICPIYMLIDSFIIRMMQHESEQLGACAQIRWMNWA